MTLINRLKEKLEILARSQGIELFGIADLTPASEFSSRQGGEIVSRLTRGVSIGASLSGQIVDMIPEQENPAYMTTYDHYIYKVISPFLDTIALNIAGVLQQEGYQALPVAASLTTNELNQWGLFSHKMAANLAGLGWVGKSCLLVTPEFGPRARFATVLTDAPLEVGQPLENRCGSCQSCMDICPAQAIKGRPFNSEEPREMRYNFQKCNSYRMKQEKATGSPTCGLCVHVCPHGRRGIQSPS